MTDCELIWNLLVGMRNEMLETEKLRAQIIGFKITILTVGGALIGTAAFQNNISGLLYALPGLVAFAFDIVIAHHSLSISRISTYCRVVLEPRLKTCTQTSSTFQFWEEFNDPANRFWLNLGNLGISVIFSFPAFYVLFVGLMPSLKARIWQPSAELLMLLSLLVGNLIAAVKSSSHKWENDKAAELEKAERPSVANTTEIDV